MSLLDTSTLDSLNNTSCSKGSMGLSHGLQSETLNPKKKNRWLFSVPGIVVGQSPALPPRKGSRPGIQLKEYEFQHLQESIWFPFKATWKTFNLVLFDIRCNQNVVFDWLERIYNPAGKDVLEFAPALQPISGNDTFKVPKCLLELYDGCGNIMETWVFENVYPSEINWGELDMDSADLVLVDLTIRYDRAYFKKVTKPQLVV